MTMMMMRPNLLWNVAQIQSTNLIHNGHLPQESNKVLSKAALASFYKFTGHGDDKKNEVIIKRRRARNANVFKNTLPLSSLYSVDPKTKITTNDQFFEYQRIHGYCQQTMSSSVPQEESEMINTLQNLLSIQVEQYLKSINKKRMICHDYDDDDDDDNDDDDDDDDEHRKNEIYTRRNRITSDIIARLQNDNDIMLKLDMWATVQIGNEAYHADHVHEDVFCSGVYYSCVPDGSAPLVFHKPNSNTRMKGTCIVKQHQQDTQSNNGGGGGGGGDDDDDDDDQGDKVMIHPEEGQVILFPPWLVHGVPPPTSKLISDSNDNNEANNDNESPARVSFAFNVAGIGYNALLNDPWEVTKLTI